MVLVGCFFVGFFVFSGGVGMVGVVTDMVVVVSD